VHSYYPDARSKQDLRVAWCDYGVRFAAAIEVGRIYATQFHPEKSQRWGLRLLENFAAIVKSGR
jgi:glutamine amidotransferase